MDDSETSNKNSNVKWKPKHFTDALNKALLQPADKRGWRQIDKLAETLVKAAVNGDIAAIKLIAERIEGKPDQRKLTEHEHTMSQQLLAALRGVTLLPKARVIDGKVAAVEQLEVQQLQQTDINDPDARTQRPADLSLDVPQRRNHGDLITAARRIQRK